MTEYPCFAWIRDAQLKLDYVFAYGARNDDGELVGDAIKHHGVKALGLCRIIPPKDRAMGRGDAEIVIDADWWEKANEAEQNALLDHELTHLKPTGKTDDLGRPKLKLRKHDVQFGFFASVAERHGIHSQEQIQAKQVFDLHGQSFWPELCEQEVTMSHNRFSRIASEMGKGKK